MRLQEALKRFQGHLCSACPLYSMEGRRGSENVFSRRDGNGTRYSMGSTNYPVCVPGFSRVGALSMNALEDGCFDNECRIVLLQYWSSFIIDW